MSAASQFFGGGGTTLIPIEIFAVGGGGSGARSSPAGGGGGAGSVVYKSNILAAAGSPYPITIGAGGAGIAPPQGPSPIPGNPGNSTVAFITAYGGGGGGAAAATQPADSPLNRYFGGSTGGILTPSSLVVSREYILEITGFSAQNTNSPAPVTPGSGAGNRNQATFGGNGLPAENIGIPGSIFGGGGGGTNPIVHPGGSGGGGSGSTPLIEATSGTANTGGGGGGSHIPLAAGSGSGGSGVVIIRYPTAFDAATVTGDTPVTPQPGYHVYQWNGAGSITFN